MLKEEDYKFLELISQNNISDDDLIQIYRISQVILSDTTSAFSIFKKELSVRISWKYGNPTSEFLPALYSKIRQEQDFNASIKINPVLQHLMPFCVQNLKPYDNPKKSLQTILDQFSIELKDSFASGAFGKIWLALPMQKNNATGFFAIKTDKIGNKTNSLVKEQMIFKKIGSHENIITTYYLDEFYGKLEAQCIIMENAVGSLKDFKHSELVPFLLPITTQIVNGIRCLHSNNVVHRDIKPSNILMTETETPIVKLCDFGISSIIKGTQKCESFFGSPLYRAPEIAKKQNYNEKIDIYAFGLIIYAILLQKNPSAEFRDDKNHHPFFGRGKNNFKPTEPDKILLQKISEQSIQFDFNERPSAEETYTQLKTFKP